MRVSEWITVDPVKRISVTKSKIYIFNAICKKTDTDENIH